MPRNIDDLPHALEDAEDLGRRMRGKRPAVFLDYDGTLTPIVDRPEDAIISDSMREAVRGLAKRCPVCVVSGRDRSVVQQLMGLDDLIVAGSHGFDIWTPDQGTVEHDAGGGFEGLIEEVKARLEGEIEPFQGASVEPKKASVAVHYRLAPEEARPKIEQIVHDLLAERPDELKVTPGKMVYEVQPKIEWDKGRAVLYLLETLDLDRDDVLPIYLGDDVTDEHAFEALAGTRPAGVGIVVRPADDAETAGPTTAASYRLGTMREVERFLGMLAR